MGRISVAAAYLCILVSAGELLATLANTVCLQFSGQLGQLRNSGRWSS